MATSSSDTADGSPAGTGASISVEQAPEISANGVSPSKQMNGHFTTNSAGAPNGSSDEFNGHCWESGDVVGFLPLKDCVAIVTGDISSAITTNGSPAGTGLPVSDEQAPEISANGVLPSKQPNERIPAYSVGAPNGSLGLRTSSESNGQRRESNNVAGSSLLPLKDRVAIVTGGSGGIGSAITAHLASLGAKVAIAYVGDPAPADLLAAEINSSTASSESGSRAIAVESDVSDPAQVKLLFDKVQLEFGPRIHILVAVAGVQDPKYPYLAETTLEQWEWVFNTNAKGTFLCCREAANRLVRGGGGRIITMSSSTVGSLRPGYSTYSASKGAIEVMTRILAKELRGTGITANAVAPGPIATPLFYAGKSEERIEKIASESPLDRIGEPKDVAPLVSFLASDAGEWVNGQVIRVNGGYV